MMLTRVLLAGVLAAGLVGLGGCESGPMRYQIVVPEQPVVDMGTCGTPTAAPDMAVPQSPVEISITCLINGVCDGKLFGRTPDRKGYYWRFYMNDGETSTIKTDTAYVCGREIWPVRITQDDGTIVDNTGMTVNGYSVTNVNGLEIAMEDRSGDWLKYSDRKPSVADSIRVSIGGSAMKAKPNIPLAQIDFPNRGEVSALIREQYLSACAYIR